MEFRFSEVLKSCIKNCSFWAVENMQGICWKMCCIFANLLILCMECVESADSDIWSLEDFLVCVDFQLYKL